MSTTRTSSTGVFNIPVAVAPNGDDFIFADLPSIDEYGQLADTVGRYQIDVMPGAISLNPEAQVLLSSDVAAFKNGAGWDIFMLADGLQIRSDAAMTEASMVITARDVQVGTPTLYVPGEGPAIPAFWSGFIGCAEDGYGGGASVGGWVPDDPPPIEPFQSVFGPQAVVFDADENGSGFDIQPPIEGEISSVYFSVIGGGLYVTVSVAIGDYVEPVSATLYGENFTTQITEFNSVSVESGQQLYLFSSSGVVADGPLAAGGADAITVVVQFE